MGSNSVFSKWLAILLPILCIIYYSYYLHLLPTIMSSIEVPQAGDSELPTVPEAPSDVELLREAPAALSSEPPSEHELSVQTKVDGG